MIIFLLVATAFSIAAPRLIRKHRAKKHRMLLARQFRASLQNMVHALRVGVGFQQSLERAAEESDPPITAEWRQLVQGLRIGQSLPEALAFFQNRMCIAEARSFATAVKVTRETGGSLSEVLETLSTTLQEREMLREKLSALTAQGRGSGYLLSVLPFLVLAGLILIAPEMALPLFRTAMGQALLAGVIVFVSIGLLVIQRIVSIGEPDE
jgi:tight adherence protein B